MKLSPFRNAFTCAILFAVFGALDYMTGYEMTSFPLYLLPISLSFFYFGKTGGYLAVVVASGLWFLNDFLTGHTYEVEIVRYWNALARVLIYGIFVYGLSLYAKTVETNRRRMDDLRAIIPMCHGCGKIFAADGTWLPIEDAMEKMSQINQECPGCRTATIKSRE